MSSATARKKATLDSQVEDVKKTLRDSVVGPLIAAKKICVIADNWADYKEEAGGLSAGDWLGAAFGNQKFLATCRRKVKALKTLESLGWREFSLSRMRPELVVYVAGNCFTDNERNQIMFALKRVTNETGNILTMGQAKAVIVDTIGDKKKKSKKRTAIDEMLDEVISSLKKHRDIIKDAGLSLPKLPEWLDFKLKTMDNKSEPSPLPSRVDPSMVVHPSRPPNYAGAVMVLLVMAALVSIIAFIIHKWLHVQTSRI